jgi:hypothetical protein
MPAGVKMTGAQQSRADVREERGFTGTRVKPRKNQVQWARYGNNQEGVVLVMVLAACVLLIKKEPLEVQRQPPPIIVRAM